MIHVEEENILVESKSNSYMFSMDFINKTLYISVYSKKQKEYLVEEHAIKEVFYQNKILEQIRRPCGTIFKNNHSKFMVRNHDVVGYKNENGRRNACNIISDDNEFDTRNTSDIPLLSQIIPFLKEAWLQI